jgi:hypothetical protein
MTPDRDAWRVAEPSWVDLRTCEANEQPAKQRPQRQVVALTDLDLPASDTQTLRLTIIVESLSLPQDGGSGAGSDTGADAASSTSDDPATSGRQSHSGGLVAAMALAVLGGFVVASTVAVLIVMFA